MKFYLSARYGRRGELRVYCDDLGARGHVVTSRWVSEEHDMSQATDDDRRRFAAEDYFDVTDADVVVSFTETTGSPHSRGGRHVEFGIGLETNKRLVVIGPRENIFHWLTTVRQFDNWGAFLVNLSGGLSEVESSQPQSKGWVSSAGDQVDHPAHYQSKGGIEAINVIESFELDFCLGSAVKYILRHSKKGADKEADTDLRKAIWYINRHLEGG